MLRAALLACLALISLSACRPAIAPAPPEPRTAAPQGAGVQACWVESRSRLGFTASGLLVRHPQGDVLVDAGNSTHFDEEIAVYDGPERRWLATFPGALAPKRSIAEVLEQMQVDPAGLRWILPTHAHLDHLGGALDLPPTPVLLSDAEAALVRRGAASVTDEVVPAHAAAVLPRIAPLSFVDEPYEIFERHADLFGDGSVVVVPLPGHTPGGVGVFVRRPDGRRIFHLGDAVNSRAQIERLRGRTLAMRGTDTDREGAERWVARLHAFAEQASDVLLLPAHERDAWRDALGEPGGACPTPAAG